MPLPIYEEDPKKFLKNFFKNGFIFLKNDIVFLLEYCSTIGLSLIKTNKELKSIMIKKCREFLIYENNSNFSDIFNSSKKLLLLIENTD